METTFYQTLVDIQIIYKKNEESIKKSAIHKKEYNMQYQNAFLGTLLSIEMMFYFCMGKKEKSPSSIKKFVHIYDQKNSIHPVIFCNTRRELVLQFIESRYQEMNILCRNKLQIASILVWTNLILNLLDLLKNKEVMSFPTLFIKFFNPFLQSLVVYLFTTTSIF